MNYTKGVRGPESRTQLTIVSAVHKGVGNAAMATGEAIAHLKRGKEMRGVKFLVQGRHYAQIRDRLIKDAEVMVVVRWTGRYAVTISEICAIQPSNDAHQDVPAAA